MSAVVSVEPIVAESGGERIYCAVARDDSTAPPHLEWIDALRGWAFFGVLVCHVGQKLGDSLPGWIGYWVSNGRFGVQLFYIVSCLTLVMSLDSRSGREARPVAAFFIRRLFRIAPMFWLAIIFYCTCMARESTVWAPHGVSGSTIAATALFVHGWNPASINAAVPGGWSIAVEMNFYLLVPLFFMRVTTLRQAVWCAVLGLFVSIAADRCLLHFVQPHVAAGNMEEFLSFRQFWLPSQIPIFALGGVLFHVLRQQRANGDVKSWSMALLLALIALFITESGPSRFLRHDLVFGIALFLCAWAVAIQPAAIFVNPITRYLGKISYSGYLTHTAVVLLALRWFYNPSSPPVGLGAFALLLSITLVLTVAVSTVTYQFVEVPGQMLGKWVIARTVNRAVRAKG
jgi:peptidoglycan/LPS O-acetylase OafA/YrhL